MPGAAVVPAAAGEFGAAIVLAAAGVLGAAVAPAAAGGFGLPGVGVPSGPPLMSQAVSAKASQIQIASNAIVFFIAPVPQLVVSSLPLSLFGDYAGSRS